MRPTTRTKGKSSQALVVRNSRQIEQPHKSLFISHRWFSSTNRAKGVTLKEIALHATGSLKLDLGINRTGFSGPLKRCQPNVVKVIKARIRCKVALGPSKERLNESWSLALAYHSSCVVCSLSMILADPCCDQQGETLRGNHNQPQPSLIFMVVGHLQTN